jgi:NAD(P)-dependent dehydrogenase (short-subunit alcohol dehydrogenase family)
LKKTVHDNITNLITLQGKTAIVTGAASGIGLGISRRLAEAGANLALLDIHEIKTEKIVRNGGFLGGKANSYGCDVRRRSDCQRVIESVEKDFGPADILVNNAGIIVRKDIVELEEEEWNHVLDVNLKAVYLLSHLVVPLMIENGGGSIINIGSGWGIKGGPKAVAYCASKGGVVNLTRAMAIDHGKQGIRVNCICPGDVHTQLLEGEADQMSQDMEEFLKEAADRPIPRIGTAEDVANAALFLACDLSAWVTGSVFVVDGGGLA